MGKDLTNSRLDRQNILNNEIALVEIQENSNVLGVLFENQLCFTKHMVAEFFEIDIRTLERYVNEYSDELQNNGYEILRGNRLKNFLKSMTSAPDINVGSRNEKVTQLSIFNFRSFLNIAMLLTESEKAKIFRQFMLDIVIDLINKKSGLGTKYINQRDKSFLSASLQEENYRRKFTDALNQYVVDKPFKYGKFTDMIYVSIFRENAKEYKKILDLKVKDKVRDTFYSEILDIIAAYENGFSAELKRAYNELGRQLSISETENLFINFEKMELWLPLIHSGRVKMSSRDLALREAFHYQLSEYIEPLNKDEYQKFLGATGDELERLMDENKEVLKRLKESE